MNKVVEQSRTTGLVVQSQVDLCEFGAYIRNSNYLVVNVARGKIKYIFLLDSFCRPSLFLFSTLNWLCISRKSLSHAKHFHIAELRLNHYFSIVPFTPAHKCCHFSTQTLRCQSPSPGKAGWQSRCSIFKEQHNFYLKKYSVILVDYCSFKQCYNAVTNPSQLYEDWQKHKTKT